MVHNPDYGRGVIGVVDITELMVKTLPSLLSKLLKSMCSLSLQFSAGLNSLPYFPVDIFLF